MSIRRAGASSRRSTDPFGGASSRLSVAAALGADERRALGLLTAPLRLFRRGEPLAVMPNVFLR